MALYRRVALGFVFLTAVVLLFVVYASLVRATIVITPLEQEISSSFLVDVNAHPVGDEVRGLVESRGVEVSETFTVEPDSENPTPVLGKASGRLTIVNNRSTSQSLVATTRFLSEGGVLFRLDSAVTVPGGGSVEARVTADQEGPAGDIGPARFTIPGLSESLQELVYGESTGPMTGGERFVTVLTQQDLDEAQVALLARAQEEAARTLREEVQLFDGESYRVEVVSRSSDTEPGVETDRFTAQITATVTGVFFDGEELFRSAERAVFEEIDRGLRPVGMNRDALQISVEHADVENGTATLRVELSGYAVPSAAHEALNRGVFSGMTPEEVTRYFEDRELAKTVQVELRPVWLKRVPKSPNKIRLEVQE